MSTPPFFPLDFGGVPFTCLGPSFTIGLVALATFIGSAETDFFLGRFFFFLADAGEGVESIVLSGIFISSTVWGEWASAITASESGEGRALFGPQSQTICIRPNANKWSKNDNVKLLSYEMLSNESEMYSSEP